MPTQAKVDAVASIKASFESADAVVLTEYRGLSVAQLRELRLSLGTDTRYSVTKNKLTAIAAKEAGVDTFEGQFTGPTAIAFVKGDPVKAAKGLTDFAKSNPQLVIKSGLFDGKFFDETEIKELASLQSREFQLARVARVLKAPIATAVRAVDALRAKLAEAEGSEVSAEEEGPRQEEQEALAEKSADSAEE